MFEVDDSSAQAMLGRLVAFFGAPRKAVMTSIKYVDQKVRGTFRTQTDPWGTPWAPLKPSTLANRRRAGRESLAILTDTATMFRSLDAQVTSNNEGFISIGGEGRWPGVHQQGNPSNKAWGGVIAPIPARPMFPVRPNGMLDLPREWEQGMMEPFDSEIKKASR